MTKNTHKTGGLLFGILFLILIDTFINYNILYMIFFLLGASFGSLLPDLDHEKAYISKRLPLLSKIIRSFTTHRCFTHSLLSLVIIFIIINVMTLTPLKVYTTGILVGCLSHIALDLITKEGVALFYPSSKKIKLGLVRTGSKGEFKINIILKAINFLIIFDVIADFLGLSIL